MGRRADVLRQAGEHDRSAHGLQVPETAEFLGHGDQVDGHMLVHERGHRLEDHPVLGVVETGRGKLLHGLVDDRRFHQHRSQDSRFHIGRLRGLVPHQGLQIDCLILLSAGIVRHGSAVYSKSGLMMIRPQCSQMMSFLLEATSTRRCGVMVLKQPPQALPPYTDTTARWLCTLWRMRS